MIKPAIDRPERVQASFEVWANRPETGPNATALFEYIQQLEDRIRQEQVNGATAYQDGYLKGLEVAEFNREQTIRGCAEIVRTWAEDHKTVQPSFTNMTEAILALLEQRP